MRFASVMLTLGSVTGTNGCTVASVTTAGVSSDGATVNFTAGGASAAVTIVRGPLVLQARPSVITTSSELVVLTLLNANGLPQSGYQITGTCTGTNGTIIALSNGPGVTNAAGETTVTVTSTNLDQVNQAGGGSCTFRTVDGSASTTVLVVGEDICLLPVSPQPEGCAPPPQTVVTLTLVDGPANPPTGPTGFAVSSSPGGLACSWETPS